MKPKVYLETTVISYLAAKPSGDLIVAAHQEVTRKWWARRRAEFQLFVSGLVIEEARRGDAQAVDRRMKALAGIEVLPATEAAVALARQLIRGGPLPQRAVEDALHIALATIYGMNCRHIANAEFQYAIAGICARRGFHLPTTCPRYALHSRRTYGRLKACGVIQS